MSSISTTEAQGFSIQAVPGRYYLDLRPTDQFFEVLPFIPIEGHQLELNVVDASGSTDPGLADYAAAEGAGDAIVTTMPSIATRSFPLKRISAELPVDSIIPGVYGSHRDIMQALIDLKVDAVRDRCKRLLIEGDSGATPAEFDGLKTMTTDYSRTIGANGNATDGGTVAAGEVEALVEMLNPRVSAENCYLVMHAAAYKHLVKYNYTDVEYVQHAVLGTLPSIIGVPVLIDNFIPTDETKGASNDCTSIYACIIGPDIGVCGVYPAAHEGQEIQVRGPVVKESTDTMWFHVSWDVSLACYNKGAVARLDGVKHGN